MMLCDVKWWGNTAPCDARKNEVKRAVGHLGFVRWRWLSVPMFCDAFAWGISALCDVKWGGQHHPMCDEDG